MAENLNFLGLAKVLSSASWPIFVDSSALTLASASSSILLILSSMAFRLNMFFVILFCLQLTQKLYALCSNDLVNNFN